jgi:Amidohydrolase family
VPGKGRFLIPGLWDMHTHAASTRGRTWRFWTLFRAHGITGTREMGNDRASLELGKSQAAEWPDRAPRVVWSSPMLDGAPPAYDSSIAIANAEQARRRVREMHALGFDFLKIYNGLSRDAFFALADEAKRLGVTIAGEVPDAVSPEEAACAGMRSFEHMWNLYEYCIPDAYALRDELRTAERSEAPEPRLRELRHARERLWQGTADAVCIDNLISELSQSQTWQVPTLVINRSYSYLEQTAFDTDAHRKWIPAQVQTYWSELRIETLAGYGPESAAAWHSRYAGEVDLLLKLARAGVGVLAGSDATDWEPGIYPGASLHDELKLLVDAGFSTLQALQAATINVAAFLNRSDLGAVEVGNLADLVLLDADPLLDIGNTLSIRAVIFDGRLQSREDLNLLLSDAERAAAQ